MHKPPHRTSWDVLVPKSDQSQIRITQDLRDLNKYVIPERQQIPTFEEATEDMAGAKFFSQLDIFKAFHQIMVHPDSRHLLTFSTPRGLRRLTRVPMGLTSASETLQRIIYNVLGGLDGVKWIHDDIVVYGSTLLEHNKRLQACLQRLFNNDITLNPNKCKFAVQEITFMGMEVSAAGIRPTETKVEAVKQFTAPQNHVEVKSFLGLIN